MSGDLRIREIVIAGGGLVGASAAVLVKKRVPDAVVTLVGPPPMDALAERVASTLPSVAGFHGDLGIDEGQLLQASGASFRIGTAFDGWAEGLASYVHAYGEVGRGFGATSFHLHWARLALAGKAQAFDLHSPAAALGKAGRFVHPQTQPDSPLASMEYGLNVDPHRYRALMLAYARHLGVIERPAAIADVRIAGVSGFVEALVLDDGSEVRGDLFVDCSGPAALVRSRLDDAFEDWSRWLPCDRVLFAEAPGTPDPAPLDRVVAHAAGWRWEAQSRAMTSHGLAYSSAHLSDSKAERVLRAGASAEAKDAPVTVRAGRRVQPWLRNCVAIGDASVTLEPLEWTNLHLAHSALDRMISKMPDRDCAPVELWDYNRETGAEAERARDFAILHYATANRPGDAMWRDAAAAEPPASLAHTLKLFRERGRLPHYEEETFTRHSWTSVLFGQGVIPRRADPLTDSVPAETAEQAMAQMREGIAGMVPQLPRQGEYLLHLDRSAAR